MPDLKAQGIFDNIMAKANSRKIPIFAHLDLTYKCNLNCIHCYCQGLSQDFSHGQDELSLDEIKRLLDELAAVGSLYLTLSGGEIFLHPHFFEIAEYAKKKNFCLTIFSNGTLIDEKIAECVKGLLPRSVEMSIYGVTAEVHEAITQMPGSFARLLNAVRLLKKHNLRVVLKTTIMEQNFHQALEIRDFSRKLGADDYNFNIEISPKNDGSRIPQKHQISNEKIHDLFSQTLSPSVGEGSEFIDDPLERPLCGTGSIGCYISPYGDVYPCIQLLVPMGNIREKIFRDIWYAPSQLRDRLNSLNIYCDLPECRECGYLKLCKKCIGLAYLETRDMEKCYNTLRSISKIACEVSSKKGGVL
ncbi:MAG: radical SAM protein [Candidatus Omnitrophica bacterium]|nr:radical SAM protein [Candidatus Omnitrophota bacterium]MDD5237055.1 radical SAM protein [Candidatus Omnitrophota bacterium]MDD5610502.1 radical SAM protein [Candidatus Omnitrophota bacterium]